MPLTKTIVLDTIKLAKFAYDNGFEELNIVDKKGLKKYNTVLKPKIQEFAEKYGSTPNIILKKFVQEYIEKNDLQKDFLGQGFHFKGRGRVHTNTWGGIYSSNEKDLNDRFSPNTQLPQLYCTIDHNTIHFGFSYGKNTKEDDLWVQRVRENSELLKKIIQVKQKDDELSIQCNEILEEGIFGERIEINTFEDLAKNWSEATWIGKEYPKSRIPDDIAGKITETFDKLQELFVFGSIGQQIPSPQPDKKESSIILAKIAWSFSGWQGFDPKGRQRKDDSGFGFVRENGLAHEWWNFYDFGDKYYYGHIEMAGKNPQRFDKDGLTLFISKNLDTKTTDLIGFYGSSEFGEFIPPKDLLSTVTDSKLKTEIKNKLVYDRFSWRGLKELSTPFIQTLAFKPEEYGMKPLGQASFVYVGDEESKVSKKAVKLLLEKSLELHQSLLSTAKAEERGKIQSVIMKTQKVLKKYFGGIPVRYWKIAPNAGAKDWEYCKEHGIIPIYFTEYLSNAKDSVLEFDQDQLLKYCHKKIPEASNAKIGANVELIWDFVHNVQIGDYVLANRGISKALGWGIITSKPKIFKGDLEATIYRDVDWKNTSLNRDLTKEQGKHFIKTIYEMTKEQFESIIRNSPSQAMKKQLILYGPPGTGKTFNAILKAHEILFGFEDPSATYKTIKENLSSQQEKVIDPSGLSWLDAIILSFDELNKDKVSVNEIKDTRIIREFTSFKNNRTISNSIWHFLLFESALDSETVKVKNRGSQELFDKDTESRWFLTEKGKIYQENLREDIKSSASLSESQFSFITFHQSYSYEDFIEGIRPDISDVSVGEQISYRIKDGLFKDICKKAAQDTSKNYVLIIDEINRGNISKIFGELITVLEENKRMGEKEEVTVRLPYSGEEFRIPNNVYIIGTMNSTDKSIALVDIALRRRFHFERLGVRLPLIPNNDARKFLESLNNIICALKNPDYEIGHSYFMIIPENDPENQELSKVFVSQILPLIEEYFFNDWEALATILGKDSIKIEKQKKFIWDEDNGKFEEETGDYDKIYGRCLATSDEIFKNTKKNLERFQSNKI